jgi:hypothetical protein
MRQWLLLVFLLLLVPMQGCLSIGNIREYSYDIDVHNTTDRAVVIELLQAKSSTISKLRADLAPGGRFTNSYTVRGEAEYLEARLRPLDSGPGDAWYILELPRGTVRSEIREQGGGLVLAPRKPPPMEGPE